MGFSWWLLVDVVVGLLGGGWVFFLGVVVGFFGVVAGYFLSVLWLLLVVGFGVGYCDYGGGCWPVLW